jgi:hypothetical protein
MRETTSERLKELVKELREKKVDAERLVIVMLGGGEQLIGELAPHHWADFATGKISGEDGWVNLVNPKRFMTMRKQRGTEMTVEFIISDLDMMSSGMIHLRPRGWYDIVENMDDKGAEDTLSTYMNFLQQKALLSAMNSGLAIPH